jgi:hypothetical protein
MTGSKKPTRRPSRVKAVDVCGAPPILIDAESIYLSHIVPWTMRRGKLQSR